MEGTTHLSDYLAILRRRRRQIIKVAAAVFTVAALLAVFLPSVYRSTAKLLVEQQEVPADVVPSTVTGYLNQRMRVVETRTRTPENLLALAERAELYADERAAGNEKYVVGKMRKQITFEPVYANVTDPRSGHSLTATVAFNVSFDAPTPETAQRAAEELAAIVMKESSAVRTQKAESASGFLGEEEQKLRQYVAELEAKLAAHKEKNAGRLPELMNLNLQMLERTQREIEETERQIHNLEERRLQLQSQLATVEPHTGKSPGGRLREVQMQYLSASSIYAPDHPDVVRAKRELDALRKQTGITSERAALEDRYKQLQGELTAARDKYAADHPDVAKLEKSLASIKGQLGRATSDPSGFDMKPDNPAYVSLQTQLDTVALNLQSAQEGRARAKEKVAEYENRVAQTPRVEQEGLLLHREYESAVKKYREVKQNLMGADLALQLERGDRGERYSILEAPELPEVPERPNRKAFLLLGLVLGLGSGIGYASIAEYMDRTVRGPVAVVSVLRAPPLAVIPYIPNGVDPPYRNA